MMWLIISIALAPVIVYLALVLFFYQGWRCIQRSQKQVTGNRFFVSVVVAFRNEADNLPSLIRSLNNQDVEDGRFEVILVNDHSSDPWENAIHGLLQPNIRLLHSPSHGKKAALRYGTETAQGDIILFTDADCIVSPSWVQLMMQPFVDADCMMAIGGVKLMSDGSFFQNFQQLDFLSLQVSGMGAAAMKHPVMCNGANLACRRQFYCNSNLQGDRYLSGDDMFLLHEAKRQQYKVEVVFDDAAIVNTLSQSTLMSFVNQRIRWASKSKGYTDFDTLLVAWVVFLANLSWVILLIFSFIWINVCMVWLGVFVAKALVDKLLFNKGFQFFHIHIGFGQYLFSQLIHPVYTVGIVFGAAFINVTWKGRKVNI